MNLRNLLLVFLLSFGSLSNVNATSIIEGHEETTHASDTLPAPINIVDETIEGHTLGEHSSMPGEETFLIDGHEAHHADLEDEHAHHHANYSPLVFIILALIIGAGTRFFLARVGIPYTVALLIIGLGLGIVGRSSVLESFELFRGI